MDAELLEQALAFGARVAATPPLEKPAPWRSRLEGLRHETCERRRSGTPDVSRLDALGPRPSPTRAVPDAAGHGGSAAIEN